MNEDIYFVAILKRKSTTRTFKNTVTKLLVRSILASRIFLRNVEVVPVKVLYCDCFVQFHILNCRICLVVPKEDQIV